MALCAHSPDAVGSEAVQVETALSRRQITAEAEFSGPWYVEPGDAFTLASVDEEGQVVRMPPLTFGRVKEGPRVAILSNAVQRDDRLNWTHAASLPWTSMTRAATHGSAADSARELPREDAPSM